MAKEVTVEKVSNARVRVKERLRGKGARLIRSIETMAHTSNGCATRLFAALRPLGRRVSLPLTVFAVRQTGLVAGNLPLQCPSKLALAVCQG